MNWENPGSLSSTLEVRDSVAGGSLTAFLLRRYRGLIGVFVTSGEASEEPNFGEKNEMIGDSVVRRLSNLEGEKSALKLARRFFGVDGSVSASYAAMILSPVIEWPP